MPNSTDHRGAPDPHRGAKFPRLAVAGVAAAHFIHDVFTALIAPVLPVLIRKLQLSYFQAGSLVVFLQGPSILNPFLGAFLDRRRLGRAALALAPGFTAVAVCLAGLAPTYAVLGLILLVAGISVAALHVSAPVLVARMVGDQVGRGMGWFIVGGEMARTVGPIIAVWALTALTLEGIWMLAPVGVAASVVLWFRLPRVDRGVALRSPSVVATVRRMRRVFGAILGILLARAMLGGALATFLPTYLDGRGYPFWLAAMSLSIYEIGGAVGALRGGALSDRIGRRPVLLGAMLVAPFATLGVLHGSLPILIICLVVAGIGQLASMPTLLATVLEQAGEDTAAANGIFMAGVFTVRALAVLGIGALADQIGMHSTLHVCAAAALAGVPFIMLIPKRSDGPQR